MQESPTTGRKALAHLAGAGIYILITLAGMIAYVLFFKLTGPKVSGMTGGAIVIFLPMMLLASGVVIWALAWAIMKWKRDVVMPLKAMGLAALLSFFLTIVYCQGGFRCFMAGGTEHMVGWFFVTFAAMGAAVHSSLYLRITRQRG